jgi:hypothetical protein
MKKILFILVMIALSVLIFSAQALAGTFDQRQVRQQKRIRDGINNHQLTRHDALRLKHEQRQIRRHEKSYLRDGHMTYRERRRLNRLQDKADRQITQSKQNRHRNPYLRPFRRHTDPYRRYSDSYHGFWR